MKAVLLARGLGSRMRQEGDADLTPAQAAAAAAGAKGMMPIGRRPFLDYVLSALADAGVTRVCLIVAPDHAAIREYYEGAGRPSRLAIDYAVQPIADGTARAVQSAQHYVGRDPFLVLNSDNLYPAAVLRGLVELDGPGLPAYDAASLVRDSGFARDRVMGFAAISIGAFSANWARSEFGTRLNVVSSYAPSVAYIVAVILWLDTFLRPPDPEPKWTLKITPEQLLEQLQQGGKILERLRGRRR
jgi:hypothetical protein